ERADGPLLALALAKLALQAAAITRYGYFRDELYYLVCAQHPAAGYVDQPPLSIWILGLVRAVLGLPNKISVMWLGAGLITGILASPSRRVLLTRWPWLAAGIAVLLFSPHLLWQVQHGWPTLEFMRNATGRKMAVVSAAGFVAAQVLAMNPVTLPLWLAGLVWLLFARAARSARALGVMYLAVAVFLIAGGRSRTSYLAPAYVALFAAGALVLERATA